MSYLILDTIWWQGRSIFRGLYYKFLRFHIADCEQFTEDCRNDTRTLLRASFYAK